MPISTDLDARGFLRLTVEGGWPSLAEMRAVQQAYRDRPDVQRVLFDIRNLTGSMPRFDGINTTVQSLDSRNPAARARRRAILVSGDLQYGIARTFAVLLPGRVEVFRDETSAVNWLLDQAG